MVLTAAVIVGLAAGMVRAWFGKRSYRTAQLKLTGLVLVAFIPQWFAFYQSRLGFRLPDEWAPYILVGSQIVLLLFALLNLKQSGFWLLGSGLMCNFLVIVLNGGLMPISPETVRRLIPDVPESLWAVGERLGSGKDIVLPAAETRLWFFSDRFLLPDWLGYQVAFSFGDVLIALGALWLLYSLGGPLAEESNRFYNRPHFLKSQQ
jgi:hypothetical protein